MELKNISMERSDRVMKKVVGPYMNEICITSPIEIISNALDQLPKQKIEHSPEFFGQIEFGALQS